MITRNATRLKLSEDILDVTRIESQSLNLKKEVCDLNDIIQDSIEEYNRNQVVRPNKNIKIEFISYKDKIRHTAVTYSHLRMKQVETPVDRTLQG